MKDKQLAHQKKWYCFGNYVYEFLIDFSFLINVATF